MSKYICMLLILSAILISSCGGNKSGDDSQKSIETVTIGKQVWMKTNLDVSKYRNGDIIPEVKDAKEWAKLTTGAWCYYNNDPSFGKIYGKLYNWYAVSDPRGLAPEGWHISTDTEWSVMAKILGGDSLAGAKLKEAGTIHWLSPNAGATNLSSFTALPGGYRLVDGSFNNIGKYGYWWTSTKANIINPWYINLTYIHEIMNKNDGSMKGEPFPRSISEAGFSVRCVKDK